MEIICRNLYFSLSSGLGAGCIQSRRLLQR
jgi:hypothetical protein